MTSSTSRIVPTLCEMNSQSAWVTPACPAGNPGAGVSRSIYRRSMRCRPPPRSWTSTISMPSLAATRSAIARTCSVMASRLDMFSCTGAIKKWAFAHFLCSTAIPSIHARVATLALGLHPKSEATLLPVIPGPCRPLGDSIPTRRPCMHLEQEVRHQDYLLVSDFDQTLSFHDSGRVLSDLIGVGGFEERVRGLADIHLVQQGGELAYLLLHDPQ